ncbi:taurine catabolism dioxygenase [Mrakia frigida]|uniref:TauD/TfdA dioxygenase family protein n=1 Tax=Mrakia frigida TaxID=29902 RepID=UPI003FCC25A6
MPIAAPTFPAPLQSTLSLSKLSQFDLTPSIGTEFSKETQISALLSNPVAIRDLSILIAQRGVVFFRDQDLTTEQQKIFIDKLGRESGRPAESSFHIHPLTPTSSELGDEVLKIVPAFGFRDMLEQPSNLPRASGGWHSDITFEPFPSNYAALKLTTIPKVGGDTLWASGYEAYDRLSPALQQFLATLTATHSGEAFKKVKSINIRSPRGHPENAGDDLLAVHPVIRTNPVTGWKSLYVNKAFTKRINELSLDESDHLLSYLFAHINQNHDLQVRFKWKEGSLAVWDNRSTFHTVTNDYGKENREGNRVISIGERPYYDPNSISRREALRDGAGSDLA